LEVPHAVKTFAIGFAWFVALLSSLATVFAIFGGQQWLEAKGWSLDPDVPRLHRPRREPGLARLVHHLVLPRSGDRVLHPRLPRQLKDRKGPVPRWEPALSLRNAYQA